MIQDEVINKLSGYSREVLIKYIYTSISSERHFNEIISRLNYIKQEVDDKKSDAKFEAWYKAFEEYTDYLQELNKKYGSLNPSFFSKEELDKGIELERAYRDSDYHK